MLTHANCFWTNLVAVAGRSTVHARRRRAGGAAAVPRRRLEHPAAAGLVDRRHRGARTRLRPRPRPAADRGAPGDHDDGRPHAVPDARRTPRLRRRRPRRSLRHAVVGGAPMPAPLLRTWHRAGRRADPGLRADRGVARTCCACPTKTPRRMVGYGRASRTRTSTSRSPTRSPGSRSTARPRGAAGARPERLRRLLPRSRRHRGARWPAAGCAPATSWSATPSGYYQGGRPAQGHLHLRRRERRPGRGRGTRCSAHPRRRRPPRSSACPTSSGAKPASPSWCSGPAALLTDERSSRSTRVRSSRRLQGPATCDVRRRAAALDGRARSARPALRGELAQRTAERGAAADSRAAASQGEPG